MELKNSHVVITGGSQGIGEALAERFVQSGSRVLVVARNEAKLEALAQRIGADYLVADLTDASQVDALLDRSKEKLGHIDVLVNNAGIETAGALNQTSREALRQVARLNFEAPLILTRDFLSHMLERDSGHIVQISSLAGVIPFVGQAAYAGSKAAVTNFSESVRLELADTPIGLTIIAPGPTNTDMWSRIDSHANGFMAPTIKRFRQMMFLPTMSTDKVATATLRAVEKNKRFVRIPYRYGLYHMLNNAPRRMIEMSLLGVKLDPRA
jgi:short-subunit dehydrogenase